MKWTLIIIVLVLAIGGFFWFQGKDVADVDGYVLDLSDIEGLEKLESGHYEGWAIFGDEKVSTGKFSVGDDLEFVLERDLLLADKIVITIEAEGDTDDQPSGIVVLSGDLVDGIADLSFGADFSNIEGNYILATPTNGEDSDETSGVWFVTVPGPEVGLTLPSLPDNWVYEGWVVSGGVPITTGRFSLATGSDLFGGFSGEEAGPPFPGEDFLVNAPEGLEFPIDLADGSSLAVISVEPDLGGSDPTGDSPFSIKPLVADIPESAEDNSNLIMGLNLSSIPSGIATVGR